MARINKMNSTITYTRVFLLLSSLAKNLLGTFNCIYLYKQGFSVLEVAIWQLIAYLGYIIFQQPVFRYNYKLVIRL